MARIYSTYEAKAKFSELLRQVRGGQTIQVSYHGKPVAEIRPLEETRTGTEARFAELVRRGEILPAKDPKSPFQVGEPRRGALARFLADRDG
jgi:prevent-host-death family protein